MVEPAQWTKITNFNNSQSKKRETILGKFAYDYSNWTTQGPFESF